MIPDRDLLRQFAEDGNEAAFAEVVRRYADLVYSVAMRLTFGNAALADDVAQLVFIDLARKAGGLTGHPTLVGWLHTATRYNTLRMIRSEQRRQLREQETDLMPENSSASEPDWAQLRPWLDEAIGQLKQADAEAVLLRFFQGRSHAEVGTALGLSEDSARKRVERALEKLRHYFSRKGISVSSALLAVAMTSNAVQAAPVGVAAGWPKAALGAKRTTDPQVWPKFASYILMMQTKTKILLMASLAVIAAGIVLFCSVPKPEPAQAASAAQVIQTQSATKQLVEAPVLAPVPASNNENTVEMRRFTLSGGVGYAIDHSVPSTNIPTGIEEKIRSMLIAGGVTFPVGSKMTYVIGDGSYVAGDVYLTNTPVNLDRAEVVFAKLDDDAQSAGQMETIDFVLSQAAQDRMLNDPKLGPEGLEGMIKSMLIAGGVDFPARAKIAYVAGKVYLTDTPANLDRAKVVFENNL